MPHMPALLVLLRVLLFVLSTALFALTSLGRLLEDRYDANSEASGRARGWFRRGDPCGEYVTCASCASARYYGRAYASPLNFWPFESRPRCRWCSSSGTCLLASSSGETCRNVPPSGFRSDKEDGFVHSQYSCPLFPTPYPTDDDDGEDVPPDLLPDWMGFLLDAVPDGAFGRMTLIDLSLPGTHDSMSYDLTGTISDEAADGEDVRRVVEGLHWISGGTLRIMPGEIEEFLRLQAKTQHLSLPRQLDDGVRFFDFRISLDRSTRVWHCLHFLQSARPVAHYLRLLREWLDEHPREVVVIWLSREGNAAATGEDQYPGVSVEEKRNLWKDIEMIFDGVMLDGRISAVGRTPLDELVRRNHRLVVYATDYVEFTDSSPFALDGAYVDNFWRGDAVFEEPVTLADEREYFATGEEHNAAVRTRGDGNGFTLMSMNTASPGWQIEGAAQERFLPWPIDEWFNDCASRLAASIPGGDGTWCPETLLDLAQLTNFYNQIALEEAYVKSSAMMRGGGEDEGTGNGWAFPNAFYIDAVDYGGVLRTGPTPLFGSARGGDDTAANGTKAYAYVDTLIAYNARKACEAKPQVARGPTFPEEVWQRTERRGLRDHEDASNSDRRRGCDDLLESLERRRAKHPLSLWHDPARGRRYDWPAQEERIVLIHR